MRITPEIDNTTGWSKAFDIYADMIRGFPEIGPIEDPYDEMFEMLNLITMIKEKYRKVTNQDAIRIDQYLDALEHRLMHDAMVKGYLREAAKQDQATGLASRFGLVSNLYHILPEKLNEGRDMLVAMLDLNGLGVINKALGDQVGDELLYAYGESLKTSLRHERDTQITQEGNAARKGGDEFVVVVFPDEIPMPMPWAAGFLTRIQERMDEIATRFFQQMTSTQYRIIAAHCNENGNPVPDFRMSIGASLAHERRIWKYGVKHAKKIVSRHEKDLDVLGTWSARGAFNLYVEMLKIADAEMRTVKERGKRLRKMRMSTTRHGETTF